jgi:hypothetical protein
MENNQKATGSGPKPNSNTPPLPSLTNVNPNETQKQRNPELLPSVPALTGTNKGLIIGLILLISTTILGGIYFNSQKQRQRTEIAEVITINQRSPSPTPDPTQNWKTYTDDVNAIEFKYPSDYLIDKDEETVTVYSPPRSCKLKSEGSPEDHPYPQTSYIPTDE